MNLICPESNYRTKFIPKHMLAESESAFLQEQEQEDWELLSLDDEWIKIGL